MAAGTSDTITAAASGAQPGERCREPGELMICSSPATAGPAIIAACITEISTATARANERCETPAASSGVIAGPA